MDYKFKYESLRKAYLDQHKLLKEVLAGWNHTLKVWKNQININFVYALLVYVTGILIGIGITWSMLK